MPSSNSVQFPNHSIGYLFVNAESTTTQTGAEENQEKKHYKTALVTLANTKEYALGALVLGKSIKATKSFNSDTDLILIVPSKSLDEDTFEWLREYWTIIHPPDAPYFDTKNSQRHELNVLVPPKLYTWMLTQYDRVAYIDSDSFFRKKIDWFNQDQYWTGDFTGLQLLAVNVDSFIGGLLLLRPSEKHYKGLMDLLYNQPTNTYINADQGLLNMYFKEEWQSKPKNQRLPITEEVTAGHCAVSALGPSHFKELYIELLEKASVFDFQGVAKPWKGWPKDFKFPECYKTVPFAKIWSLIALSLDMNELSKVMEDFQKTLTVPDKTANEIIKKFVIAFNKGKVSKHLGLFLKGAISSLYTVPIKADDWGKDKSKEDL